MARKLQVVGLPQKEEYKDANIFFRSIIHKYVRKYIEETNADSFGILAYLEEPGVESEGVLPKHLFSLLKSPDVQAAAPSQSESADENDYAKRALQYKGEKPFHSFDRLVLNDEVLTEIKRSLTLFSHQDLTHNVWGLREIDPFPVVALNFYGPSGTGKTLAAHAIADYLKKTIIIASYAQIESMYHGEGPKNVESIFLAAERDNAVLFIDEADSLLSRRLTNVTQGSEQAINSMRSQLLICLEKFRGIVIFATNLAENYDKAFETRIRSIHFAMPDESCRRLLWDRHIPKTFPLCEGLDRETLCDELAKSDDFCGRDIRNAVKSVAEDMVIRDKNFADIEDFRQGIERVRSRRLKKDGKKDIPLNDDQKSLLGEVIQNALPQDTNSQDKNKELDNA